MTAFQVAPCLACSHGQWISHEYFSAHQEVSEVSSNPCFVCLGTFHHAIRLCNCYNPTNLLTFTTSSTMALGSAAGVKVNVSHKKRWLYGRNLQIQLFLNLSLVDCRKIDFLSRKLSLHCKRLAVSWHALDIDWCNLNFESRRRKGQQKWHRDFRKDFEPLTAQLVFGDKHWRWHD